MKYEFDWQYHSTTILSCNFNYIAPAKRHYYSFWNISDKKKNDDIWQIVRKGVKGLVGWGGCQSVIKTNAMNVSNITLLMCSGEKSEALIVEIPQTAV